MALEAPRRFSEKLLQNLYRISLTETSFEQIENLHQLLLLNPDANLVLYFNHIAPDDPAIIFSLYRRYIDPEIARKVLTAASKYHSNFFKEPFFAAFIHLGRLLLGYKIVEVVQTDDEGNPRYGYTKEQALGSYRQLIKAVSNLSRGTFIIAPEGTRSPDGTLQRGRKGVVSIIKRMMRNGTPTIVNPVGIVYQIKINPRTTNVGSSILLNVGQPIPFTNKKDPNLNINKLMTNLAALLPVEQRGYYR